jgi:hypothetical protein
MNERPERICEECGDDLACQGYRYCSDCLESADIDDDLAGLSDEDVTEDPYGALLPDLSGLEVEAPRPSTRSSWTVSGGAYGGIPDHVRPWRLAIREALNKVRTGATTEVGMCLKRTREYYGVDALYPAAKNSLAAAQAAGKAYRVAFEDVGKIPRGSVVYWTGPNSQYGHVAIALGGGMCVSTDWPRGRFGRVNIATLARSWGYDAIFWSPLVNDVRVWAPHAWTPINHKRIPGHLWQIKVAGAPGRVSPNAQARIVHERDAGDAFFPQRAIKHEGRMWLQGGDGYWYARSDVRYIRPLKEK